MAVYLPCKSKQRVVQAPPAQLHSQESCFELLRSSLYTACIWSAYASPVFVPLTAKFMSMIMWEFKAQFFSSAEGKRFEKQLCWGRGAYAALWFSASVMVTWLIVAAVCFLMKEVLEVFLEQYPLPMKGLWFDNYYYCCPIKTNTRPFSFPKWKNNIVVMEKEDSVSILKNRSNFYLFNLPRSTEPVSRMALGICCFPVSLGCYSVGALAADHRGCSPVREDEDGVSPLDSAISVFFRIVGSRSERRKSRWI